MVAAITLFSFEEEEMIVINGMKRKHRYWMKPYLVDRTDIMQRNTFSKLHRDLISVGKHENKIGGGVSIPAAIHRI